MVHRFPVAFLVSLTLLGVALISPSLFAADRAYIASKSLWKGSSVSVCFVNPSSANQQARALTKQAVTETWQKFSNLKFTGWKKCPPKSQKPSGIKIKFDDSNPRSNVGTDSNYTYPSMHLNHAFKIWSPSCGKSDQQSEYCQYVIAVHEFGHAIAFKHEQVRKDTPGWCTSKHSGGQGASGGVTVGKWDKDSVMNYCNPTWSGNGVLSASDIAALQKFYGTPNPKEGMTIELAINQKQHSAGLNAGEVAEFSFRANQIGWVYFIGMTDTKESKVRYLLNISEDPEGLKLMRKVSKKEVGKWISLGSFEVGAPFGEERIIAVAAKKDLTLPDFEEGESGLMLITEEVTLKSLHEKANAKNSAISIIQMTTKP